MSQSDAFTLAPTSPAVEARITKDMLKRTVPFLPFIVLLVAGFGSRNGAISVAFAMILVIINFIVAAVMLTYAGRISFAALGAAALFGFLLRLGLLTIAVLAVKDQSWFRPVPLSITLVLTHLGLLVWELRFVSASLAHPDLKPVRDKSGRINAASGSTASSSNAETGSTAETSSTKTKGRISFRSPITRTTSSPSTSSPSTTSFPSTTSSTAKSNTSSVSIDEPSVKE
jgi:hypothetical protein